MARTARLTRSLALCIVGAGLALAGCNSSFTAGGTGFSNDRFTYESTEWSPKTVELIDTRTAQTIWSVDIPVGQKLTMKFKAAHGITDTDYPDRMTWVVQPHKSKSWKGQQAMLVPSSASRLIEMTLRSAPESIDQTAAFHELPALEPEELEPVEMDTEAAEEPADSEG